MLTCIFLIFILWHLEFFKSMIFLSHFPQNHPSSPSKVSYLSLIPILPIFRSFLFSLTSTFKSQYMLTFLSHMHSISFLDAYKPDNSVQYSIS